MSTSRGSKVREYVIEKISKDESQDPGHNLEHIFRVYEAGMEIGVEESADLEILEPALLLHDIERPNDPELEKEHAALSADHSRRILPSFGYTEKEISEIAHAILAHSRSSQYEAPRTLEAKIVYDADKQDGLGFAGIARACMLCGVRGYNLRQTARWYLGRIADGVKSPPYTKAGRQMAREKLKISLDFCKEFLNEEYEQILKKELGTLEVEF